MNCLHFLPEISLALLLIFYALNLFAKTKSFTHFAHLCFVLSLYEAQQSHSLADELYVKKFYQITVILRWKDFSSNQ